MSRLLKATILGLLTGVVGVGVGLFSFGLDLEENIGLDLFFALRGTREAPADVMIVSVDQTSAEELKLPSDVRKWSRSLHARLIENLLARGAAVIAFDMIFDEPKSIEEDRLFADAVRKAHNVVLCEYLKSERVSLTDRKGPGSGHLDIEKLVVPIPPLAQSAIALAPFPLPKVPVRVNQYWTFKTGAGGIPTLPIVVFQVFALQVYDDFIGLLGKVSPSQVGKFPRDKEVILNSKGVEKFIQEVRAIFESEPMIGERMLRELRNLPIHAVDAKKLQLLRSFVKLYQRADSEYLNFYGPPGSVTAVPYHQALEPEEEVTGARHPIFKGKAVFVGLSERFRPEQKDGFHTVFSQSTGVDLSGVEIAATAFGNLLEDRPIRHLSSFAYIAVLFLGGFAVGFFCRLFPTILGGVIVLAAGLAYLAATSYSFKASGRWYPLVVPLFVQAPLAFLGAFVWRSIDTNKERENIRRAFEHYLPNKVVDQLAKNVSNVRASNQVVHGVCLFTDAERYTSLSETMAPEALGSFMNKYYEILFKPIKEHGGIVSTTAGDSMLAIWVTDRPDTAFMNQACHAALDMKLAVHQFNQSSDKELKLPTRIGLHSGNILLGNIGAIGHYEYQPVGDIVNTANRIENLNKYLKTQVLVSEDVIGQLDAFLTRDLGRFLLAGKTKSLGIHELVCRREESDERQRELRAIFSDILGAFRGRFWVEAEERLQEVIERFGKDGPSLFYLDLCKKYRQSPPDESWDGVIPIAEK